MINIIIIIIPNSRCQNGCFDEFIFILSVGVVFGGDDGGFVLVDSASEMSSQDERKSADASLIMGVSIQIIVVAEESLILISVGAAGFFMGGYPVVFNNISNLKSHALLSALQLNFHVLSFAASHVEIRVLNFSSFCAHCSSCLRALSAAAVCSKTSAPLIVLFGVSVWIVSSTGILSTAARDLSVQVLVLDSTVVIFSGLGSSSIIANKTVLVR